jgi:hypothetical protein
LLAEQDGVVSRSKAMTAGVREAEVRRLLSRRELVSIHRGVYVNHTGEPTWSQRAWAGVLATWPSALSHASALRAAEGPGSTRRQDVIAVAIDRDRHIARPAGVTMHRSAHLEERVQWHLGPPRVRYHDAVLDVAASARTERDALAELARGVQSRRTTAGRMMDALDERLRTTRGRWLAEVLHDVAAGTCSVLEHAYLRDVERAHGLMPARRQVRDRIGSHVIYRDVEYHVGLVVELDGYLHHSSFVARELDMDRDLITAVDGKDSVRVGWGQVWDRPCWTADCVASLLIARGWDGRPRTCGKAACAVG